MKAYTGLFKYLQPFVTTTWNARLKIIFFWGIFLKKTEIYFVLNNTRCQNLEAVPQ